MGQAELGVGVVDAAHGQGQGGRGLGGALVMHQQHLKARFKGQRPVGAVIRVRNPHLRGLGLQGDKQEKRTKRNMGIKPP